MPRTKRQSSSPSSSGANNMPEFVRCELSDDQKAFVKANIPALTVIFEQLEELVADNYKLTISYDDTADCYSAFLIGKENQVSNAGYMLSAYAPVLNGCLALLLYKHFTVLKQEWGGKAGKTSENSWR